MFFDRFTKLAVGNKQLHVHYKMIIDRLEKTTLTWSRIVEISNFWIKYTSREATHKRFCLMCKLFWRAFTDATCAHFSKLLRKTLRDTKNLSIKKLFQYKFTIKCEIYSTVDS